MSLMNSFNAKMRCRRPRSMNSKPRCHCQGGRLLVVLGPVDAYTKTLPDGRKVRTTQNKAMYVAQSWALGVYEAERDAGHHCHVLVYAAPAGNPGDMHSPRV